MGTRESPIFRRALPSAGPATARGHAPCNRPHRGPWQPRLGLTPLPPSRAFTSWPNKHPTALENLKLNASAELEPPHLEIVRESGDDTRVRVGDV
jgi:hypothetical protein